LTVVVPILLWAVTVWFAYTLGVYDGQVSHRQWVLKVRRGLQQARRDLRRTFSAAEQK
jgi:hypothetical protein